MSSGKITRIVEKEKAKNWKEKLVNLPLIGWFFGIVFRAFGIYVKRDNPSG